MNALLAYDITDSLRLSNVFRLQGTLHLSCYLNIGASTTLKDLLDLLGKEVDSQFQARLEVIEEEAKTNPAMVNPFDLNTDNMTRIAGFNLLMPRRVFFKLSGFFFNDYLLFYETEEECFRRIKDSLGVAP